MRRVGAYELKTHLAAILDEVESGGHVVVTRNGAEVAELVPRRSGSDPREARERIEALRGRLGAWATPSELLEWIREGRR